MNTQPTPKETLERFRSRNQLKAKAPEVKPKQVQLGLLSLPDVLGQAN